MIGEIRLFLGDGIGVYTVKVILKEKGRFVKLRPCSVAERTFSGLGDTKRVIPLCSFLHRGMTLCVVS